MHAFHVILIRIGALLSYCGGPLLLSDQLGPALGKPTGFGVSFAPVGLLLLGTYYLPDRPRGADARWFIRGGMLGALWLVLLDAWAIRHLLATVRPDQGLMWAGIAVGLISAAVYIRLAHRPVDEDTVEDTALPRWSGPSLGDWGMLAVGLMFVAIGLWMLPRKPQTGMVTLLFFGACTLVFAATIARKLRQRRLAGDGPPPPGGVPIRPSRARLALAGAGLAALGAALLVFSDRYSWLFQACAGVMAAAGCVLCVGVAFGWLPAGYIQFDPDGLTLARRAYRYHIPWDAVVSVAAGEYHNNPVMFLELHDREAITAPTDEQRAKAIEEVQHSGQWIGADVMLMTTNYGLDLPSLTGHVARYVTEPEARSELR